MTARLDMDWVRAHVERRLTPPERAAFEARLRTEPELAELVDRYDEVSTWPTQPFEATAVRFEDLALSDEPSIPSSRLRSSARVFAIAAGVLLAFAGGVFALTRRGASAPESSGPVVLQAIEVAPVPTDALPFPLPIPALVEDYFPVVDRKLHFVEGLDVAKSIARLAGRRTLVFVHLDGCPACAELERTTFRDARVLDAAEGYVFAKVSAKVVGQGLEIPSDLGLEQVDSWPMFAVFDADGSQIDAFGGMLGAEKFTARLARGLASAGAKFADWTAIHDAARRLRRADAAASEGEKSAFLTAMDLGVLPSALAGAVRVRRTHIQDAARSALVMARALVAENRIDAAITELDQRLARFVGSPIEADLKRVRDRVARDRKFPALEYVR